ncbi:WPP domain-associated protein-like isoform X2 [Magnolia sinica]|uniref:WPP domain-associated protein-like isoform X2 n=1 Tax=Magnolia sinica TaxID=86752 RepID=UPI002658C802|nr:WPP domain-associated protein-like isoform X2 [Magnolia sinica]
MENSEVPHTKVSSLLDSSLQSSSNLDGTENSIDDSAFQEQIFMEDLDLYFEDINNRLTISRMVSDSVIKGMVNAVSEEAAENIALKEAEVALLQKRLHLYESNAHIDSKLSFLAVDEPKRMKFKVQPSLLDLGVEQNRVEEDLGNLKIAAEEQFQQLKNKVEDVKGFSFQMGQMSETLMDMEKGLDGLKSILRVVYEQIDKIPLMSEASLNEWNWERDFQKEVDGIVFQSAVKTLHEDFQEKSLEQRSHLSGHPNKNLLMKVAELSSIRQDLTAISSSLFCPEPSKLSSHGSLEVVEEWTNERKDRIHGKLFGSHLSPSSYLQDENGTTSLENSKESKNTTPEVMEYLQLKHMSKEEIINYFKTKMTDMKRDHELKVQYMTEEYFSLRREFLKEKGSSNSRKDKDFDALRKKIPEVILKLDDILVENEKSSASCDDYENICILKDRVNSLLSENHCLQDTLINKRKEVESFSLQLSDATEELSHHLIAEANFRKQIKKLECDVEDLNIESFIREDICKCVLGELTSQIKCNMEDSDIQAIFVHETCAIIFREAVRDAEATVSLLMMNYNKEKERRVHLGEKLLENENALRSVIEDNGKLKEEKSSLSAVVEEEEKSVSEMRSTLTEQRERFELVCQELNKLRDQVKQHDILVDEKNRELDLVKSRLDEALEESGLYKIEITKVDQKLQVVANGLREAEGERGVLQGIIQEKQNMISAAVANEVKQRKKTESIFASVQELSKSMADFECRVTENIMQNNSRLEMVIQQCSPLVQQAALLKRKGLVYKQRLERRCSDLQMAEKEVDLLGDEVDALLSLLSKIYIALDHYSIILQHYPGHPKEESISRSAPLTTPWKRTIASHDMASNGMMALTQ